MHAWARKISESENLKPEMFVFTIKFCRACSSAVLDDAQIEDKGTGYNFGKKWTYLSGK